MVTNEMEQKEMVYPKWKDYLLLIKVSLSTMVVFSAVVSYLTAPGISYDLKSIVLLFLGGMLVTGSANTINQITEKDSDAGMKRTANRPLAAGRMSVTEGWIFALLTGISGCILLYVQFTWQAAAISAVSLFIYAFMYTPMKKVNSMAVLLGAIPGALPCLIGWAAAADVQGFSWIGGWILFAIQFIWQFPHFWAIAWVAHKDYSSVGFKLLPSDKGPTRFTALQCVIYSLVMIPVGLLPYYFGVSGVVSLWIVLFANAFLVGQSLRLYKEMSVNAARRVMFSSYIYLPIVQLALLVDKIKPVVDQVN